MLLFPTMALAFQLFFFLCLLGHTVAVAGQESVQPLSLHGLDRNHRPAPPQADLPLGVFLTGQDLREVSSSVLAAESWLRAHVFSFYPASKITHIVVGHDVLCSPDHPDDHGFVLPCLKNLFYALTRWGLQREIKLSPSFSSQCLSAHEPLVSYREDLVDTLLKPLLEFIRTTNSTYLVNPPQPLPQLSAEIDELASSHLNSITKIESFDINPVYVIFRYVPREITPISRKLSFVDPYPPRPHVSPSSNVHDSFLAHIAKSPLPPLVGSISSPPPSSLPFPFPPQHSPVVSFPSSPPFGGLHLPPCNPSSGGGGSAAAPEGGVVVGNREKLWCVAKPSVPAEMLQEAIDFACGEGGADCDEIQPNGKCYSPDTVLAHAAYAFNSYWQKTKRNGGTCDFGGAALIINADPSFLQCTFIFS